MVETRMSRLEKYVDGDRYIDQARDVRILKQAL
jgi:hypothetical protein